MKEENFSIEISTTEKPISALKLPKRSMIEIWKEREINALKKSTEHERISAQSEFKDIARKNDMKIENEMRASLRSRKTNSFYSEKEIKDEQKYCKMIKDSEKISSKSSVKPESELFKISTANQLEKQEHNAIEKKDVSFNSLVQFSASENQISSETGLVAQEIDEEITTESIIEDLPTITNIETDYWVSNGIIMIVPASVKTALGYRVKEKSLIIIIDNVNHVVKLKWKGLINNFDCIGCNLTENCEQGTKGVFGNKILFESNTKDAVLIPVNTIDFCCEKGPHKDCLLTGDLVDQNSICCIEDLDKFQMHINSKVTGCVKMANYKGICRWIGLINNLEMMGVELTMPIDQGTNGTFAGILLFECEPNKGGLFKRMDFMMEEPETQSPSSLNLNDEVQNTSLQEIQINYSLNSNEDQLSPKNGLNETRSNLTKVLDELLEKSNLEKEMDTFLNLFKNIDNNGNLSEKNNRNNKFVYCEVNEIYLLDPKQFKKAEGQNVKSKTLIIISNNKKQVVILKWKGLINEIYCLGCELKNPSFYGNNGIFKKKSLFSTKPQKGALIPVNLIDYSCEISGHKKLIVQNNWKNDDEICCIESIGKLVRYPYLEIGNLIEKINTGEKGVCRWLGYVNDKEAVGVELNKPLEMGTDGTFSEINLFECESNKGFLFEPNAFKWISNNPQKTSPVFYRWGSFNDGNNGMDNLIEIPNFKLKITNPHSIKLIENGTKYIKSITFKFYGETFWINLKWKGLINNELHFGCELAFESEYGTNGTFINQKLFDCCNHRGVLMPMKNFEGSCQFQNSIHVVKHRDIVEKKGFFYFLKNGPVCIQPDSMCCVENISGQEDFEIESKVKYSNKVRNKVGICKWIGLINGQKSVGVEMEIEYTGSENLMPDCHIFSSKRNKGSIFLIKNITLI